MERVGQAMTSALADRKSVIFPFPSSPHWVPTTTTDVIILFHIP